MRKLLGFILLQTITLTVFAASFFQVINLHIQSEEENSICFVSTDWLDKSHCGPYPTTYYTSGPKNWRLVLDDYYSDRKTSFDESCSPYLKYNRTVEDSGQLDIFATLVRDNPFRENYTLKDCRLKWTSMKQ